MRFSRNWLARYVELPASVEEIARRLTFGGFAVEGIEEEGGDVIFDADVTTNRPDAMCHLGLARELAVLLGHELTFPPAEPPETAEKAEDAARVTIEAAELCPRYVARVVRGVTVGESPAWLREHLTAIGQRPINNLVDITNFVLWETGQPIHAFDLSKLSGSQIRVRRACAGERLTTLDGEERELTPEMLVIADAERPVALAGVMGGLDSEVTADTVDVLIESAHFDRKAVRKTARGLGLHTDASHRFERGADPEMCRRAADRVAALVTEIAGGEVLSGAVDARGAEPPGPHRGHLELARLSSFAGSDVPAGEVERILTGLGFGLEPAGSGAWRVTVPTWRTYDFEPLSPKGEIYPADLYEEVLRIRGYEVIPATLPAVAGADLPRSPSQRRRDLVRDHLAACGYAEAINFAFQSRETDARFPVLIPRPGPGESDPVALDNPLSELYAVLRRSLVGNLVANARFNLGRGAEAVRLFEVGHVFARRDGDGVEEREAVALVAGGALGTPWERHTELDFFDLKGVIESLGEALGTEIDVAPAGELPGVVPGTVAELSVGGRPAGWMGRIVDGEIDVPLFAAELLTDLFGSARLAVALPSRFPGIRSDVTLTHSLTVPWREIRDTIAGQAPEDLADFDLKDRYRGEGVPEGAVNTTITFLYNSPERSLTQEEINERQEALTGELTRRFGWQEAR